MYVAIGVKTINNENNQKKSFEYFTEVMNIARTTFLWI